MTGAEAQEIQEQLFKKCGVIQKLPGGSTEDFWVEGHWSPILCELSQTKQKWLFSFAVKSPCGREFHCEISAESCREFQEKLSFTKYFHKSLATWEAIRKQRNFAPFKLFTEVKQADIQFSALSGILEIA